jgi:hypothetical protein
VRRLRRAGCQVVVVQPSAADLGVMGFNPMIGSRIEEVVRSVEDSVRRRLAERPELRAALGSPEGGSSREREHLSAV